MRVTALFLTALVGISGCEPGQPCRDNAECTKGATCRCDDQGRLIQESRDANGDKKIDRLTFNRDAAGRVVVIDSDWSSNGTVDRRQKFSYDSQGRRLTNEGWIAKCGGERFHWSCTYETPCPAPYEQCAKCRKKYEIERRDGGFKPCPRPADS